MSRVSDIAGWVGSFVPPGTVTELRALAVNGRETWAGWFDGGDLHALAQAALELERKSKGLYFTPNPVRVPDGVALRQVVRRGRGGTTDDAAVLSRQWLLIDIDPVRFGIDGKPMADTNVSSTDAEREAAWQVLQRCRGALSAFHLGGEVVAESGNGWHLCYPVALPNDDDSRLLHQSILAALESRSGDEKAHVDVKTFNAARIWKLYGTQSRKGEEEDTRKWRYSHVVLRAENPDRSRNTDGLRRAVRVWSDQDRLRRPASATEPDGYARKALENEVGKVRNAAPGSRNSTLNTAAFSLGQLVAGGMLDRGAVEPALVGAAVAVGLSHGEAATTIRSGLDAGAKEPRKAPERTSAGKSVVPSQMTESAVAATTAAAQTVPPDAGISCGDLMLLDIPEPRYAVPKLIPEGLTILAGRPKARKSWFALQLALGVAQGANVLGAMPPSPPLPPDADAAAPASGGRGALTPDTFSIDTEPGDVLYLALEDTRRRLKKRVRKILDATGWIAPARLEFRTESLKSPGGVVHVEQWLIAHPDARLVVVDTLQKFRPSQKGGNKDGYADDYEAIGPMKALADRYAVAVLFLHHSRKASAESPFDEISGTLGLTGAADGMFLLQRDHDADTAQLYVSGRDLEEETITLGWDNDGCVWSITAREEGIHRTAPEVGSKTRPAPKADACVEWMRMCLRRNPMRLSDIIDEGGNRKPPFPKTSILRAVQLPPFVQYDDESAKTGKNGKVYQWVRLEDEF